MTLTLTDLFCGAGGSSTGAIAIPDITVRTASNHWDKAIETHSLNHPDADHICADISQIDPRYFPRTDLLWASPSCTKHSVAQGKRRQDAQPDLFGETLPDAAAERSRATMWDVVRFAEYHQYLAVIVENVVDVYFWPPFQSWMLAMQSIGYVGQIVYLNSMHAQLYGPGAPQSRDRIYVVFTRAEAPRPDVSRVVSPAAICPSCGPVRAVQSWKKLDRRPWGKYRSQYVYRCPNVACRNQIVEPLFRPAAEIIDWSLRGTRIGDRDRPLAAKTMARIAAGIQRYWQPLLVPVEGRPGKSAVPVDQPARTMTTRNETGLLVPTGGTWRTDAVSVDQPAPTRTTRENDALALPPFLTQFRDRIRHTDPAAEPLPTVVADGANHGLVSAPPFIAELRGGSSDARLASEPLATVTASGNHHGLVTAYYGNGSTHSTREPLSTVTAVERHALLMRNNTARGDQGQMTTPVTEPIRTVTTTGHQSLLDAERPTIDIYDVLFRMLEPREIAAAMDFPPDYQLVGNRRIQVRLEGNAVTPPAARDLVGVVMESLTGQPIPTHAA
ncbi:DNA cytosine methyltransferase [Mycobacterium heckeshornense]|uniref:DNA cytosine methyltransferase n=1 Tax=Mycobacterium heckeshornense TaxID=110505 RepID=UPI000662B7D1|nr:DNA cytosine methyltransferase [Mycobacterium heckeshornense]KMV22087.1 DNA methyltransferase [Mycobacterium heckeshornense]